MKNFKQLQENVFGSIKTVVGPRETENLRKFAFQFSSAYQPSVEQMLERIDHELNKYGFCLGDVKFYDVEGEDDFEAKGKADMSIEIFSMKIPVDNLYVSLKWERLLSGQQYAYRHDGSGLNYAVSLRFNDTTKESLSTVMSDSKEVNLDDDNKDTI